MSNDRSSCAATPQEPFKCYHGLRVCYDLGYQCASCGIQDQRSAASETGVTFGDWWRDSPISKSRPELYGICEAVWLAAKK